VRHERPQQAAGGAPPRHRARRRFGQHFLERTWVEKVVRAVAPAHDDVFLEIGPGQGALTRPLLQASRHVIAFEIDRDLAAALRTAAPPNLTVIEGDFLEATPAQIQEALGAAGAAGAPVRVAGNLPYNIASPILFHCVRLFEAGVPIRDASVMLQREVADRILSNPSSSEYGVLSVTLRHVADVTRLLSLPPGAFRPAPEVHSAVIRLAFHPPSPAPRDLEAFRALTRAVFTRRRKTLTNALGAYPLPAGLSAAVLVTRARIDGRRRPETLDIAEFVRLSDSLLSE
jgi:16S rRNA (adenine1518-N6/adenine1519-N6)-dimethyltransferase